MMLGARELLAPLAFLPAGQTLTIAVKLLMQDDRFGSFEYCSINDGEATGRINTFQPTAGRTYHPVSTRSVLMSRSVLVTGASKGIGRAIIPTGSRRL